MDIRLMNMDLRPWAKGVRDGRWSYRCMDQFIEVYNGRNQRVGTFSIGVQSEYVKEPEAYWSYKHGGLSYLCSVPQTKQMRDTLTALGYRLVEVLPDCRSWVLQK